jgi:hypothetical protein
MGDESVGIWGESRYDGVSFLIIKSTMLWLLLEAGVAGLLLILIVVLTLPRKPKGKGEPPSEN